MRLSPWVLRTVLASTLTFGLVACGDDQPSSSSDEPSTSVTSDEPSPSGTSEASSEDSGSSTMDKGAFLRLLKSGYGDSGSAHLTMRTSGSGDGMGNVVGDMSYGRAGNEARVQMTMPGTTQKSVVLVADGKVYMSMAGLTPAGKYFQVPADSPLVSSLMTGPGSLSFEQTFKAFDAALDKTRSLGQQQIAGETTDHYRLWLDTEAVLRASGVGGAAGKQALATAPPTIVYDVWLDPGDHHLRRMSFEMGPVGFVMDITKWGEPVTIDPPAPADVVDAPPAISGMTQS